MSAWPLNSEIEPNYDGALMRAKYLKGGVRVVKTKNQRNTIGLLYRYWDTTESTIVYVQDDSMLYILNNAATGNTTTDADWNPINLAGISSFKPVGNWIPSANTPTLTDLNAVGINGNFYFVASTPTPYNYTDPGLFLGATTTVVNGDMIVSVGTNWIAVGNSTTWDSIAKPQSIIDYVNGIVRPHTHTIADITDFVGNTGLTTADVADYTIAFASVPDAKIPNVKFLRTHYRRAVDEDALFLKRIGDSGIQAFTFVSGGGIDTDLTAGSDILNIGVTNANVINIGNSSTQVNINGTVTYQNQTNLAVTNKLIRTNVGGSAASGFLSGLEVEEGGVVTAYFKTNSTRDGWMMNSPSGAYDAEFLLGSMTANRQYTLPDATGTLALVGSTLSTSLTSAKIWLGNGGGVAAQVTPSGDWTMSNAGVATIANDAVTTVKILAGNVTYAKIQNLSSNNILLGRQTTGAGSIEELSVSGGLEFTTGSIRTSAFTGDVTKSAGSTTLAIAAHAVSLGKFQQLASSTRFLGKSVGTAGDVEELTSTLATAQLDVFTSGLKGLAPSSGGGTTNFLRADGTWVAPGGTGHAIYNDVTLLTQRSNLKVNNGLTATDSTPYTTVQLGGALLADTLLSGAYNLNINTQNFGLFNSGPSYGSGSGIAYLGVCTTPPASAPTTGVFLYVQLTNGVYELKIMDSAGNIKGLS